MTLVLDWVTIDAQDPPALARFWAEALSYDVVAEDDDELLLLPRDGSRRRLLVGRVPEAKTASKNRLHFDLRPDDQEAEVRRLEGLGARRIDIGQGDDVTWVVMADPEGNELCVLRALGEDERGGVPYGD